MSHSLEKIKLKAFNGDNNVQKEVEKIISEFNIKCVIETGTYQAFTTRFIANMNPDLIIHSIEIWDVPIKNL